MDSFFALVGAASVAYLSFKFVLLVFRNLTTYFVGPMLQLSADLKKAGSWAVVTGCTDGIGKAYAQQLAKKKINVVLISRTQSKLDDLAKEIESTYNVQTKTIAADFTRTDIYDRIKSDVHGLDIGTLVNNVGMSYEYPEYFVMVPDRDERIRSMINVNLMSTSLMTSIVLPRMIEKRNGFIINISSAAGSIPVPLLAMYSSCKAFIDYFSQCLQLELQGTGVSVQVVKPCFVTTKMSKIRRSNLFVPTPTTYVQSALATVGLQDVTSGYWLHTFQEFIQTTLPGSLALPVMKQSRAHSLRALAKKKAKE